MVLGVYVHIPFCVAKCHYCDFVSYGLGCGDDAGSRDTELYLDALYKEAKLYEQCLLESRVQSLYIGGGTPTCLTSGQLSLLLDYLKDLTKPVAGAEITVEGNPGTLDERKLSGLREGGCNRLSLGVQSFIPREIKLLGRIHSLSDVYNTYKLARSAGFENINLDLMYGLPGQELNDWRKSLQAALSMQPEHISLYQLNIERDTLFYTLFMKGLLPEFDQEIALDMYKEAIDLLTARGYIHYEISNFARPGKASRHNRLYWQHEEYLGLGAGASGYMDGLRYTNTPELTEYQGFVLKGERPVREEEIIDNDLAMAETMFLGLRLLQGVDKKIFYRRFNISVKECYGDIIDKCKKQGLLDESKTHIFLTRKGLPLANLVFMEFCDTRSR